MSRSADETRREFLLRLARASAFVPPALLTLEVGSALGQGQGGGGGRQTAPGQGGLSPNAQTESPSGFEDLQKTGQPGAPWQPGQATGTPPWSRPPPTQGGPGRRH